MNELKSYSLKDLMIAANKILYCISQEWKSCFCKKFLVSSFQIALSSGNLNELEFGTANVYGVVFCDMWSNVLKTGVSLMQPILL